MMKMFFFIGFSLILFLFKNILFLFLILELLFFSLLMFFISFNSNMYFLISLIFIVSSAILGLIILIMNIRSFSNDSMKVFFYSTFFFTFFTYFFNF